MRYLQSWLHVPLIAIWLALTAAAVLLSAIEWNRLTAAIDASEKDKASQMGDRPLDSEAGRVLRRRMHEAGMTAWAAGVLAVGAGLFAVYLTWVTYVQERKQVELQEQKLEAEKSAQEKSAFLATMSHEIRTPMNAILGFSELLGSEPLSPNQSEYVRSIRQSGRSLLQLINDVLDLSKIEAGMMELRLEPTEMREMCDFLRTMFSQQAVQKSLQLHFEVASGVPNALLLDRLRLRQVLVNLVSNAIKFTPEGHVSVRVDWQKQETDASRRLLAIDVEDTGVGISPEKQSEVFKPFVQADTSVASDTPGTGLGLSIVKRFTEVAHGPVLLESAVGKGTVVHLRFSDVAVSSRLPAGEPDEALGAADFNPLAPATVLVVDDSEPNRHLVASLFARTHHRLRFASNGREALQDLSEKKPDIVLLDIRMPVMDGWTALDEIRRRPGLELLPVIAVTTSALASEEVEVRSRFNGYIRKPFSRQVLFQQLALFLPRGSSKMGSTAPPPASAMPHAPPPDWRTVSAELHRLQTHDWPTLCQSLAINETRAFAAKLRDFGQATACERLTAYGQSLAAHADAFAIAELERDLAAFPQLVQSLENSRAPRSHASHPAV